jgi:hypothetical protein
VLVFRLSAGAVWVQWMNVGGDEIDGDPQAPRVRDQILDVLCPHRQWPAHPQRLVDSFQGARRRVIQRQLGCRVLHPPHLVPNLPSSDGV